MRAGGSTHLYLSKVPRDIIQRFGRWISPCFLVYMRYDNIALRHLGRVYRNGHEVSGQQLASAKLLDPPNCSGIPTSLPQGKGRGPGRKNGEQGAPFDRFAVRSNLEQRVNIIGVSFQPIVYNMEDRAPTQKDKSQRRNVESRIAVREEENGSRVVVECQSSAQQSGKEQRMHQPIVRVRMKMARAEEKTQVTHNGISSGEGVRKT